MPQEQQLLVQVKNLENQVRLFLYENYYFPDKKNLFPSVINLAFHVAPIQFLVKEIMALDKKLFGPIDEGVFAHKYVADVYYQFQTMAEEFRLLIPKNCCSNRVSQVWRSMYEVLKGLQDLKGFDLFIYEIDELEHYLDEDEE